MNENRYRFSYYSIDVIMKYLMIYLINPVKLFTFLIILTVKILIHQMCISIITVSSVMLETKYWKHIKHETNIEEMIKLKRTRSKHRTDLDIRALHDRDTILNMKFI